MIWPMSPAASLRSLQARFDETVSVLHSVFTSLFSPYLSNRLCCYCFPAYGSLLNVKSVSPRSLVATVNGNPKTTIISRYNSTNCSDKIEAVDFYSILQDFIRQLPKHIVIIVAGNMNAQVGSEDVFGISFHDKTNRYGF